MSILLTGANGGLGTAIVDHIVKTPALASAYTGIYTVRNVDKASALQASLKRAPKTHKSEVLAVDLSSVASTIELADDINAKVASGKIPRIKALILNAAYQDSTDMHITPDGFEMAWQVNYLANFILALRLLQSFDEKQGRIVILGSWSHDTSDERNNLGGHNFFLDEKWKSIFPGAEQLAKGRWCTQEDDPTWFAGYRRYGASKLCAVMLGHELAIRLGQDSRLSHITVAGLDPGAMGSDLTRRGGPGRLMVLKTAAAVLGRASLFFTDNPSLRPLWKSAADAVRAALDLEVPKGELLYMNGSEKLETGQEARDPVKRKDLWQYSVGATRISPAETLLETL